MFTKRLGAATMMGLTRIVAACSSGGGAASAPAASEPAASAAPPASAPASAPAASEGAAGGGELVVWADDMRAAALKPLADQFGEDNGVTV